LKKNLAMVKEYMLKAFYHVPPGKTDMPKGPIQDHYTKRPVKKGRLRENTGS